MEYEYALLFVRDMYDAVSDLALSWVDVSRWVDLTSFWRSDFLMYKYGRMGMRLARRCSSLELLL